MIKDDISNILYVIRDVDAGKTEATVKGVVSD